MDKNHIISVLARDLSYVVNCSSIAFSKSLTLSCWSTKPWIPAEMVVFMNIKRNTYTSPPLLQLNDSMTILNRHGVHRRRMWYAFHEDFKIVMEYVAFLQ